MGTQFDALAHQGRYVRMADGSVEAVFYNGFTDTEMMGSTNGLGGVTALGVEHMSPSSRAACDRHRRLQAGADASGSL